MNIINIILKTGYNSNEEGVQLNDHLHPSEQIKEFILHIKNDKICFKSNSCYPYLMLQSLLKASMSESRIEGILLESADVIEYSIDGIGTVVPKYKNILIEDDLVLSNQWIMCFNNMYTDMRRNEKTGKSFDYQIDMENRRLLWK